MNLISKHNNAIKKHNFHFPTHNKNLPRAEKALLKAFTVNDIDVSCINFFAPSNTTEHTIRVPHFLHSLSNPNFDIINILNFKNFDSKNVFALPPFLNYCYGLKALAFFDDLGYRIIFLSKNKTSPICLFNVFWLHFFLERYKSDPKVHFYLTEVFPFNYYFKEYNTINDHILQNWIQFFDEKLLNPDICPQTANLSLSKLGFSDLSHFLGYEYVVPENFFFFLRGEDNLYDALFVDEGPIPSFFKNVLFELLNKYLRSPITTNENFNNICDSDYKFNYYLQSEINLVTTNPFTRENFLYYEMDCSGLYAVFQE